MGLRNILTDDDPALRKMSRDITNFDRRLHALLDDMAETVTRADGAGIAAPQLGILRNVCVVCLENENLLELVNPQVTYTGGTINEGAEGCLSVPNRTGWVKRPTYVIVEAQDRHGKYFVHECEEFEARVICHEIDHLKGILYTDIMERFLTAEEIAELEEEENNPRSRRFRRKKKRRRR